MEMSKNFYHALTAYDHAFSIKLYDKEIVQIAPKNFLAWNNRGVSKAFLGIETKNVNILKDGLSDIKMAIDLANELDGKGFQIAENKVIWVEAELKKMETKV